MTAIEKMIADANTAYVDRLIPIAQRPGLMAVGVTYEDVADKLGVFTVEYGTASDGCWED